MDVLVISLIGLLLASHGALWWRIGRLEGRMYNLFNRDKKEV